MTNAGMFEDAETIKYLEEQNKFFCGLELQKCLTNQSKFDKSTQSF